MDIKEKTKIENGDLCIVEVKDNWNKLGYALAIYNNGRMYDQFVIEDEMLEMAQWDITDAVTDFFNTGLKYEGDYPR